jgi:cytochrome d ubiquinol oxidase subunit I
MSGHRTKHPAWEAAARFWTKIFAVNFGLGVATGIVMEFEFGTNWAAYSRFVGDVFGSALAAEGIFAFFLESVSQMVPPMFLKWCHPCSDGGIC